MQSRICDLHFLEKQAEKNEDLLEKLRYKNGYIEMPAKKSPKSKMKCGQVKKSTRPGKKIMKLYCSKGKKKLVHAGAKGYGNNYSSKARSSFKKRHKCSTAKAGTARHLACKELWGGKEKERQAAQKAESARSSGC